MHTYMHTCARVQHKPASPELSFGCWDLDAGVLRLGVEHSWWLINHRNWGLFKLLHCILFPLALLCGYNQLAVAIISCSTQV